MDSFGVSHLAESRDVDKTAFYVSAHIPDMTTFSVFFPDVGETLRSVHREDFCVQNMDVFMII